MPRAAYLLAVYAYEPPLLQLASWLSYCSLFAMVACLYQNQRSHANTTVVDFIPLRCLAQGISFAAYVVRTRSCNPSKQSLGYLIVKESTWPMQRLHVSRFILARHLCIGIASS